MGVKEAATAGPHGQAVATLPEGLLLHLSCKPDPASPACGDRTTVQVKLGVFSLSDYLATEPGPRACLKREFTWHSINHLKVTSSMVPAHVWSLTTEGSEVVCA